MTVRCKKQTTKNVIERVNIKKNVVCYDDRAPSVPLPGVLS